MTDYKNRCAELAQHLDDTLDFTISSETRKYLKALISTVRSELAEPEPEESTTGGKKPLSLVCNCYMKGMPPNPHQDWQAYFDHCAATGIISGLRLKAIQPTPSVNDSIPYSIPQQPEPERPADEELDNIYWDESWRAGADDPSAINEVGLSEFRLIARAVLARFARPSIEPAPVSERLPGPEDCLGRPWEGTDAGFCWWFYPSLDGWRLMVATRWEDGAYQNWIPPGATHWLPHHVLPVPTTHK